MTARLDRYTTYVVLVGFSLLALYPMLSILFLALHKKSDLVTGFSFPTTLVSRRSSMPGTRAASLRACGGASWSRRPLLPSRP